MDSIDCGALGLFFRSSRSEFKSHRPDHYFLRVKSYKVDNKGRGCVPRWWVKLRRRLGSAEMAAAYPRAHPPGGDDVRRLFLCLYPCQVRPTEEVRVSSPRLLQRETLWPSASEQSPRPSTFGAPADEESAVLTNNIRTAL